MENENDQGSENKKPSEIKPSNGNSKDEKKAVAKDLVELTHVETKKQEISKETKQLADVIKAQGLEEDHSEKLSNDEITILESFVGKRLFLRRIAIVINQSRMPLGIEPFKKEELERLLDRLIHNGYIEFDIVNDERVYYLSEKGKEAIQ
jgi:hypothetical protein